MLGVFGLPVEAASSAEDDDPLDVLDISGAERVLLGSSLDFSMFIGSDILSDNLSGPNLIMLCYVMVRVVFRR